MKRKQSILFEIKETAYSACLSDMQEQAIVNLHGNDYSPLFGCAGIYEIVRTRESGLPVGIELQLGSSLFDFHLEKFPLLKRSQLSGVESSWLFLFRETESELYIEWEQILTNNPYFSKDGLLLLLISLDHLSHDEYSSVEKLGVSGGPA